MLVKVINIFDVWSGVFSPSVKTLLSALIAGDALLTQTITVPLSIALLFISAVEQATATAVANYRKRNTPQRRASDQLEGDEKS